MPLVFRLWGRGGLGLGSKLWGSRVEDRRVGTYMGLSLRVFVRVWDFQFGLQFGFGV